MPLCRTCCSANPDLCAAIGAVNHGHPDAAGDDEALHAGPLALFDESDVPVNIDVV